MPFDSEQLECSQGDTFTFGIVMQPSPDGSLPDLTGAAAEWTLSDGNYSGARVRLTKSTASGGLTIALVSGAWNITGALDPADTPGIPAGVRHHECKLTLANGAVSHPAKGPFILARSTNP